MTINRSDSSHSSRRTRRLEFVRLGEHGVQGRDDRHAQPAQGRQQVAAGGTAVDAVLVLEADEVHLAHVEELGQLPVLVLVVLSDFEAHPIRIGMALGRVVHRRRIELDGRDTRAPATRRCR